MISRTEVNRQGAKGEAGDAVSDEVLLGGGDGDAEDDQVGQPRVAAFGACDREGCDGGDGEVQTRK